VTFYTAGGGGYGDPRERPCELRERDINLGYVSNSNANDSSGAKS
jgi:N-methylhydantoinase B